MKPTSRDKIEGILIYLSDRFGPDALTEDDRAFLRSLAQEKNRSEELYDVAVEALAFLEAVPKGPLMTARVQDLDRRLGTQAGAA